MRRSLSILAAGTLALGAALGGAAPASADTVAFPAGLACADFDLGMFAHEARYNESEQRIEMHLRSKARQRVSINGNFTVDLREGETIWTESSYKFLPGQVRAMAERAGFKCEFQNIDSEWPFAQSFLRVPSN